MITLTQSIDAIVCQPKGLKAMCIPTMTARTIVFTKVQNIHYIPSAFAFVCIYYPDVNKTQRPLQRFHNKSQEIMASESLVCF